MANPEVLSHPGFGVDQAEAFEAAWVQWFEYVGYLNDGSPEDGDSDEEHIAVDDEDED
jgi:hypothetical protein